MKEDGIVDTLKIIIDDIPNEAYNNCSIILDNYLYNEYRKFVVKKIGCDNTNITFCGYNLIDEYDLDNLNIEAYLVDGNNDYLLYNSNIGYVYVSTKQDMLVRDQKLKDLGI